MNLDFSYVDEYYTIRKAVAATEGAKNPQITTCCQNKRVSHAGFIWMYKEDYENITWEFKQTRLAQLDMYKNNR